MRSHPRGYTGQAGGTLPQPAWLELGGTAKKVLHERFTSRPQGSCGRGGQAATAASMRSEVRLWSRCDSAWLSSSTHTPISNHRPGMRWCGHTVHQMWELAEIWLGTEKQTHLRSALRSAGQPGKGEAESVTRLPTHPGCGLLPLPSPLC